MNYTVTISLLSPLHIGSGNVLLRDYDFKTVGQQTWVLDRDAILTDVYNRTTTGGPDWQQLTRPPGELVDDKELHAGSRFARYALTGITSVDQVREQVKDVYGQCYLPGSSFKGVLRTLLMSHAIRSGQFKPNLGQLGDRREWAGQAWEQQVFGRDPNHDLLRALIVADSKPLSMSPSPLMLLNAQVFTGGNPGSPIVVEALKPDTILQTTLRIDDYLFSNAARALGFTDRQDWLLRLGRIAGEVSQARIKQELTWYRERPGFEATTSFYNRLAQARLDEDAFLLQMGWGAGWTGKSVGMWLPKSDQERLRRKYKLGRPPRSGRDWEPDVSKSFPKSRRLRARRSRGEIVADLPLGWVLVEMKGG
ncbi:MAG: type III-A CRISPR-associated RAMP protein Csm5 [Anaerolineae bacterium]|nr:type III-A CRISPR-associated RAMP protein Csm5 [Anaerolineae bacterium]